MTQPANVLWISCVGEKGGAEVYLLNFLRNLDRSRFRPLVVLLRPGPFEAELRSANVETFVLSRHRMRNAVAVVSTILKIRQIIRQQRVRLVHSNMFRGHAYGGLAARMARVPSVWSVHSPERKNLSTEAILRIPVGSVTANCPRTADWFASQGMPVNVIWPPVDLDRLNDQTSRSELCTRYGLPSTGRWIGMAARFQRYKGHEFLIRALAGLPPELNDVHAIVMGAALFGMEEDYLGQLRQLAAGLGVSARVHFPGFVPDADLNGLMQACEIMVHPALDEDFGLSVAQSQALGRPVIAFAATGPSAIIEPGRTGELVAIGDQGLLNLALRDMLLRDPGYRESLGRAGRERVERFFAAPKAARRLERVYEACLGEAPLELDALRQPIVGGSDPG